MSQIIPSYRLNQPWNRNLFNQRKHMPLIQNLTLSFGDVHKWRHTISSNLRPPLLTTVTKSLTPLTNTYTTLILVRIHLVYTANEFYFSRLSNQPLRLFFVRWPWKSNSRINHAPYSCFILLTVFFLGKLFQLSEKKIHYKNRKKS
jgi:hypothetical protein